MQMVLRQINGLRTNITGGRFVFLSFYEHKKKISGANILALVRVAKTKTTLH